MRLTTKEVQDLIADIITDNPEVKKLPVSELKELLDKYKVAYDDEDLKAIKDELGFYNVVSEAKHTIKPVSQLIMESIKVDEVADPEYFDVESKLRDICFQKVHGQITNDEASKQIQDIIKDSEELDVLFTDVAPEALVDKVIDHYGWTESDLSS